MSTEPATGPSATARLVAAQRLSFPREAWPDGDPGADETLARDVARGAESTEVSEAMQRYLLGRTAFFDRSVVRSLERGVGQFVALGAGYDGRALRYARSDVRWFEVDRAETQRDKRGRLSRLGIESEAIAFVELDLAQGGVADALLKRGFEPDAPAVFMLEGVSVYLELDVLADLLCDLRTLGGVGTRLMLSVGNRGGARNHPEYHERLRAVLAQIGEPARNDLGVERIAEFLDACGWLEKTRSERARAAGFVVAAPNWMHAPPRPTRGRVGPYLERTFGREGREQLAEHLAREYGLGGDLRIAERDLGVFHVQRDDGVDWIARIHSRARSRTAADGDAAFMRALATAGFPAERPGAPEPVSTLEGQSVVVTEFIAGRTPRAGAALHRQLGQLLGRLHKLESADPALRRSGGAWHHLVTQGTPADELNAAADLLNAAQPRLQRRHADAHATLAERLASIDGWDEGLPHAPAHPDLAPVNAIATPAGELVLIDWTGAGSAPRLASLGFLLTAAARHSQASMAAALEGYAEHVTLLPEELERVADAFAQRAYVFGAWELAFGRIKDAEAMHSRLSWVGQQAARAQHAAERIFAA